MRTVDTVDYSSILDQIHADERWQKNIQYGAPRRGHAEGSVAAHIEELSKNLDVLWHSGAVRSVSERCRLRILIAVHDAFKAESKRNAAIEDPQSHASLATEYLRQFDVTPDMLAICQYHDLGYAVYRNYKSTGRLNENRLRDGLGKIKDIDLYLLFCIIDSCTASKGREMIRWFIETVWILRPEATVGVGMIIGEADPDLIAAGVF